MLNADRKKKNSPHYYSTPLLSSAVGIDVLVLMFTHSWNRHCQGAFNNGVLILDGNTNDFTRLVSIDKVSLSCQACMETVFVYYFFFLFENAFG